MSEMTYDEKVKEVSVADGYVYIDLLCGLRLSAPIVAPPAPAEVPVPARPEAALPASPLH